ncbi:MAG: M56 family metallopeptidase [bacterium]
MFEWLAEQYLKLVLNYKILLGNPSGCGTVELLRLFTFTLLVIFLFKLSAHLFIFNYLKRKFSRYSAQSHPGLFQLFEKAVQKVGLKKVPPLYQFRNENPLIFTIGSLRPAIFMAPQMAEKLKTDELEAALVHELTHIKRRDNLLIWFLEIFFLSIPILFVQVFAISFIFSIEYSVYAILGSLIVLTIFKAFLWKRIVFMRELSCDDLSVDKIKNPLILASSLVNVWRLAKRVPKYRWQTGLSFTQTLLPARLSLDSRIERLLHYRRPWFKFFLGRAAKVVLLVLALSASLFLWQFHAQYGATVIAGIDNLAGFHICSADGDHEH